MIDAKWYDVCEEDLTLVTEIEIDESSYYINVNGRAARYSAKHGVYILDPLKEDK